MSQDSNIEWTDATWTPVKGCTRASEGCDHCYAVTMTHRLEKIGQPKYAGLTVLNNRGERHFNGKVVCDADALAVPLRWKKPRRVFVSSMSDIFHPRVPFGFIQKIFGVMGLCKQHTFQVLTKRPERMAEFFIWSEENGEREYDFAMELLEASGEKICGRMDHWTFPFPNVWLGTSVESDEYHQRAWDLLKCPAAVRLLSLEPLIAPVDLDRWELVCRAWSERRPTMGKYIDWVIVGGESGPKARPCDVAWIRSIVQQCKAAGVPCFVKQLGANVQCRNDHVSEWLDEVGMGLDFIDTDRVGMQGDPVRVLLRDRKGGDMAEWPSDLRVREMPGVGA